MSPLNRFHLFSNPFMFPTLFAILPFFGGALLCYVNTAPLSSSETRLGHITLWVYLAGVLALLLTVLTVLTPLLFYTLVAICALIGICDRRDVSLEIFNYRDAYSWRSKLVGTISIRLSFLVVPLIIMILFILTMTRLGKAYGAVEIAFLTFTSLECVACLLYCLAFFLWAHLSRPLWMASFSQGMSRAILGRH